MGWARSDVADKIWNLFYGPAVSPYRQDVRHLAKDFLDLLETEMDFDTGDECDFVNEHLRFDEEREEWVP